MTDYQVMGYLYFDIIDTILTENDFYFLFIIMFLSNLGVFCNIEGVGAVNK